MTSKYFLISKPTKTLFCQYKGKAVRLSNDIPYTVEEVVVGKVDTKIPRIVTTFRNSKGEIIERAYDYPGNPLRNDIYSRSDYVIGEEEFVESTTKKVYTNTRTNLKEEKKYQSDFEKGMYKEFFWTHIKTETNHLSTNIKTGENVLSRTSVVNLFNFGKQLHRFIEFPHIIGGKIKDSASKFLCFEVDEKTGKVIKNTIYSDGVNFSKNDPFLQFRAHDIDGVKEPITKQFMVDRKVDKYDVSIDTKYIPTDDIEKKQLSACFFADLGTVAFNILHKPKSKASIADTARHEVEHIWHYLLDARNKKPEIGTWQFDMYLSQGPIRNKKLKIEADKCTEAIENYVSFTENYDEYIKNYIEVEANKWGSLTRENYDKHGEKLRKSLPHIPKELL